MRLNLLSYAGGLGLVAGALMWPGISHAQGFCYLINSEGEVVNLDDMCQDSNDPEASSPATGASDASAEQQGTSSSSEVINTTTTSPAGTDSTGANPAGTNPAGTDSTGTTPAGTSPAGTNSTGTSPAVSPARTNPAVAPGSNENTNRTDPNNEGTNQANPNTDDAEAAPAGAESPRTPTSETTSDTPDDATERGTRNTEPENRLDIPVREIETPEIPQIQTPQRLDSTGDDIDTSEDGTDTSQ